MADIVISLGLDKPSDERRLAKAIETYANWRAHLCDPELRTAEDAAPDIMVKTGFKTCGQIEKTLIFQDRRWAAAFLRIWRLERRRDDTITH